MPGYPANYSDPRPEGLGAPIFWVVLLVDESAATVATYDRLSVLATLLRWCPAHCKAWLCVKSTLGTTHGIFDDAKAIFDHAIFQ